MPRGHVKIRKSSIGVDVKFNSPVIAKLINYIMVNGKKTIAERIVYMAFEKASEQLKLDPMEIFDQAIKNVGPIVEVKSKRIGGANYQVPMEVSKDRRNTLAMRWVIAAARSQKGRPMNEKLASEIINAFKGEGNAIKKKEDTHRMAEANKAFAHFARF
ncbi:MAG: 30S ribosomal protein S7 [Patescibacteria group bacterium]|jgi:small subunit ribosomal protein S7